MGRSRGNGIAVQTYGRDVREFARYTCKMFWKNRFGFLCIVGVAGCAADGRLGAQSSAIAIPGPWDPPASTRAIAATQFVTVTAPPPLDPTHCSSTNPFACSCSDLACMPALTGTRELDAFLRRRYPYLRSGGLYCCRQNSGITSTPQLSVHAIGRAIDLMVTMEGSDADNTLGDAVANWLVENAEFVGIQRVIWDHTYWNGERGFGLLPAAAPPHTNHIHLELSVEGAARRTSFFLAGIPTMTTCTPRCEGPRLLNADCSVTECATSGSACVAGPPPACGPPPPPEPTAATAVPGATLPTVRALTAPSRVTWLTGTRMFDTRTPESSTRLVRSGGATAGPLSATVSGTLSDWSVATLPTGSSAVWLNLTGMGVSAPGFLTAYSTGQPRPDTSNLNFLPGIASSNAAAIVLGAGNGITFDVSTDSHIITDVYSAFTPTGAGLDPAGPTRVLDTRSGAPLAGGAMLSVNVGAPPSATGLVATVTAIAGATGGFLRAWPCGSAPPDTSNVNFAANRVVANTVQSALGAGRLCLLSNVDVHVLVDVTGFLSPGGALSYIPLAPQRILDTRGSSTLFTGRLGARQVVELPLQRLPGMPANVGAAVANLTAVSAAAAGFLTAFPCGRGVPATSSLNFAAAEAMAGLTVAPVGGGSLCVFASVRTHLLVDLVGVWTGRTATVPDGGVPGNPDDIGEAPGPDPINPSDAGAADAAPLDGAARDAGPGTGTPSGCGCRTAGSRRLHNAVWVTGGLVALVFLARRRRVRSVNS